MTLFILAAPCLQNATSKDMFPALNLNLIELPAVEASATAHEMKSFQKHQMRIGCQKAASEEVLTSTEATVMRFL